VGIPLSHAFWAKERGMPTSKEWGMPIRNIIGGKGKKLMRFIYKAHNKGAHNFYLLVYGLFPSPTGKGNAHKKGKTLR
jgi:hypothetical protein